MCPEDAAMTNQGSTDRGTGLIGVAAGVPTFRSVSFEDSVRLFKQWGFQVEPGPRPEQVTLIVEGQDFRTVSVWDAQMLPELAAVALQVRWQTGVLSRQAYGTDIGRAEASPDAGSPAWP